LKNLIKKHAEKFRFAIVGLVVTAIDFVILFTLVNVFGFQHIPSNIISTSVAMVFSFFINKSYTFRANDISKKRIVYFIIITLFGLWVIQTIIIDWVGGLLGIWFINSQPINWFGGLLGPWFKKNIVLFLGKGLATASSLVWNYLMYRKFVFVNKP